MILIVAKDLEDFKELANGSPICRPVLTGIDIEGYRLRHDNIPVIFSPRWYDNPDRSAILLAFERSSVL